MKQISLYTLFIFVILASCKKPENRPCWKSWGDETEKIIPLDSVNSFKLYKNIKYRIFEDTTYQVIVRGGENMLNQIEVLNSNYELTVNNTNSCNFLRNAGKQIEVEIHYPYFKRLYFEPSDSVIFENTINSDSLFIEIRESGGSLVIDANADFFSINVSHGTGDYILTGYANNSEVKIQNNGFADASGFSSPNMFIYHNSTGDLKCNLEGTNAKINLEATGNLYYSGNPSSTSLINKGSGEFIPY